MLFCSKEFIFCFLPIFLILYYIVPLKIKNYILFIASIIFYAVGELKYVPLMLLSLVMNYLFALLIENEKLRENKAKRRYKYSHKTRKLWLVVTITYDFGMLFVFKYFTFFTGIDSGLTLPLGISFYTFQIVSYVIDVYKGTTRAERNIVNLGVFLCMFPQLIAGPIVLYTEVSAQIHSRKIVFENVVDGIKIFIVGLGSKMIIANIMGSCWNSISMYGIESISTKMAWLAMFAYTFQIFFDFYGYSLMAIGLGKMIGFNIPDNFDSPYVSKSVTEFWHRWHITLGTWFKEYVYIPLGGNRKGFARTIINMFIVWALTGLWHGASWNFVLWGIMFFVLLVIEKAGLKKILDKFPVIGHTYMMLIIPMSWIIFALEDLKDIGIYFTKLFPMIFNTTTEFVSKTDFSNAISNYWPFFLMAIIFSFDYPKKMYRKYKKSIVVSVILIVVFWLSVYRIFTSASNPFLYFRF